MFASKLLGSFCRPDVHSPMPKDATELSDTCYKKLIAGQEAGNSINFNTANGIPELAGQVHMVHEL